MNNHLLTDLIQNFNPDKLIPFMRDRNTAFKPIREPIPEVESDQFSQAEKLGEIPFSLSENFIVCAVRVNKNLSERSGKKAQYELAKKILKDSLDDAGIFVFYDASGNFRFSLVYANYLGKKRDWSTFRRFTYFVSPQLTNKTFLQRIGEGDFSSLEAIKDAFSVEKVTKDFYQEISYWYFWACQLSKFPQGAEEEENGRQISVIRLITRMIFVWFMRERDLVPGLLFKKENISSLLINLDDKSSSYYLAILQNLFFATLNTKKSDRQFRSEVRGNNGHNPDFGDTSKFRHQHLFTNPAKLQDYFGDIPFLNGGLFDCLDQKDQSLYVDGFTDIKKHQPSVPNELFFSTEKEADFNTELGTSSKTYKVKGLFEILSAYNFTIDENTVDDKDVALDPELLGRVFENLLASFNPETSTTARKATGSYYTPREIVDYMVDESLKAYLKTHLSDVPQLDEKLSKLFLINDEDNPFDAKQSKRVVQLVENVRIVDPAVGSGAFPMGALNKLVFILSKVDKKNQLWKQAQLDAAEQIPDAQLHAKVKASIEAYFLEKNPDYGRKLYLIQKCIYGVDIQQIAVEIAKLRFFISLLVEETIEKDKENWGIEPLPNLDFKIMQGNSLISEFEGIRFDLKGRQDTEQGFNFEQASYQGLIMQFEQKKAVYQSESDHQQKRILQNEIDQILIKIFKQIALSQQQDYARGLALIDRKYAFISDKKKRDKITSIEKQKYSQKMGIDISAIERQLRQYAAKHMKRDFFPWELYFAEVFNEKGGFDVVIGNPPYIGEKGHKELFEPVKQANLREFYLGKMDYFYFFFHLALNLGNPSAQIAFISTNYYPTATGAVKLRKDFHYRATINRLVNFNELKIFETATGQHNMITLLSKGFTQDKIAENCIANRKGFGSPDILNLIISWQDDQTEYFRVSQKYLYDGDDFQIRIQGLKNQSNNLIQEILNKIKSQGVCLGKLCNINQGIIPGANKVTKHHLQKYNLKASVGDGIFVLSNNEISRLQLEKLDHQVLMPWFKNSDIARWVTQCQSNEKVIYLDRSSDVSPNILSFLARYKAILSERREVENGVIDWWQLQWPRSKYIFLGEKIVAPQRSPKNTFGYNEGPWYASADVYFITEKEPLIKLKFILALLNSKLYYLWLYHRGKRKGETLELYGTPLSEIPVKVISTEQQQSYIDLVDKILSICYSDDYHNNEIKQSKVSALEKELDHMIYGLYELSESEMNYVESFSS